MIDQGHEQMWASDTAMVASRAKAGVDFGDSDVRLLPVSGLGMGS